MMQQEAPVQISPDISTYYQPVATPPQIFILICHLVFKAAAQCPGNTEQHILLNQVSSCKDWTYAD